MSSAVLATISPLLPLSAVAAVYLQAQAERLDADDIAERTLTNRVHGLAHLRELAPVPLGELTAPAIRSWVTRLAAVPGRLGRPGHGRAKLAYDALRHLLRHCVLEGAIAVNPAREVHFRYRARPVASVPDDRLIRVRAALETEREGRRGHAAGRGLAARLAAPTAGLLVLGTGCRAGEARLARVADWDPAARQIRLCRCKNERRAVAVPAAVAPMLDEQAELVGAGELFPSPRGGGAISEVSVWRAVVRAGETAGVVLWPHKLRHALARRALRIGRRPAEIAQALGDTVDAVVRHYLRGEETPAARDIVEAHARLLWGEGCADA